MKTSIIIILLLLVGVLNEASVSHNTEQPAEIRLKEFHIKEIPLELRHELFILKKNLKKYDKIIKRKELKDSILVVPDTAITKK